MAKIVKKKIARPMIPPRDIIERNSVSTSICIDLTLLSERKGLKSLKVRKPETLLMYYSSSEETTTIKSSQFQASLR